MSDIAQAIDRIAELTRDADEPVPAELVEGRLLAFRVEDGQSIHLQDISAWADTPADKDGQVTVTDAASLVAYVNRHKHPRATTLWGSRKGARVVAVLDDHEADVSGERAASAGGPRWGRHRATLQLEHSPNWLRWIQADGKWFDQETFADFLEQNAVDVIEAATMYEVATTLRASRSADFESALNVGNGDIKFRFAETTTGRAGQKGELEIPQFFELALAVYEGQQPQLVKARLLYRVGGGDLRVGFRLLAPDQLVRDSFDEVCGTVALGVELPVMLGTPRA